MTLFSHIWLLLMSGSDLRQLWQLNKSLKYFSIYRILYSICLILSRLKFKFLFIKVSLYRAPAYVRNCRHDTPDLVKRVHYVFHEKCTEKFARFIDNNIPAFDSSFVNFIFTICSLQFIILE